MYGSGISYYIPHERVFVNSKRRSSSVNAIKTNNFLEFNRNFLQQNFRETQLHTIKHDSNFLLGSSIVNLNFVNNVSNPTRGYEGCRNIPILPNTSIQRNSLEDAKFKWARTQPLPYNNFTNYENKLPFENYNYYRYNSAVSTPTNKNNLNIEDRIITPGSCQTGEWPSCGKSRDFPGAILTKNYLTNSSGSPQLEDQKSCEEDDSKFKSRINKLEEYLNKSKTTPDKPETTQKKVKITIGKPTHEFIAKYPDPIEKELEKWHNSHNSTLKWERIKHGLYSVGGSIVQLIKLNGSLYVEGHGFKKYKGQINILKFVEEKESRLMKEKI